MTCRWYKGYGDGDILNALLIDKELPNDLSALPSSCPSALLEAMKACLNFDPAARPSFSQLAQELGTPWAAVAAHLEALTLTPEVLPWPCLLRALCFLPYLLFHPLPPPTRHNCSLISTQIAKLIATYVFNKYQVVSVQDLAKLRPETVDRIALTLNLGDVSALKFVEACESLRDEKAKKSCN